MASEILDFADRNLDLGYAKLVFVGTVSILATLILLTELITAPAYVFGTTAS